MAKRKKHVMSFKCCENCINRPESLYKACEFFWHVAGSSKEREMCIFKRCVPKPKQWTDEEKAEEIRKCKESPAYFFNKYCVLYDKNGNELEKPVLTDEDIRIALQVKKFVDAYDFQDLTPQTSNKIQE